MIGRIVFLSAAAFAAYQYIRRSNNKAKELNRAPGTVDILPPAAPKASATEELRPAKQPARLSAATEDLSGR
jgi:hypothetical protein